MRTTKGLVALTILIAALAAPQDVRSFRVLSGLQVEYFAHPRDFVQFQDTYAVPQGKRFVVTALGRTTVGPGNCELHVQVDGVREYSQYGRDPSMESAPLGLVVHGGSNMSITFTGNGACSGGPGQVWGYLVNDIPPAESAVRLPFPPHLHESVIVREGAPFVVPAEKIFVATGLAGTSDDGVATSSDCPRTVYVVATGGLRFEVKNGNLNPPAGGLQEAGGVVPIPPGFTVPAGGSVNVFSSGPGCDDNGRVWGYLVDA